MLAAARDESSEAPRVVPEDMLKQRTGSDAAPAGRRLRVSTQGSVTVRGGADDQVQYTITKRVKARREEEARQLLRQFLVKTFRQGDIATIEIAHGGEGWGSADLNVI